LSDLEVFGRAFSDTFSFEKDSIGLAEFASLIVLVAF